MKLTTRLVCAGVIALSAAPLGACAGIPDAPCFDGWTEGLGGPSRLWAPPPEELARIADALGDRGRIACVHRMPGGELIVLSGKNGRVLATDMVVRDGAYIVTDEGLVVGGR